MKNTNILIILAMFVLNTALFATNEEPLENRGGKYGKVLKDLDINPPLEIPVSEKSTNRSSCYSHVWTSARVKVRDYNYWIGGKVIGYGYTTTTYGTSRKSCAIPFKVKSMNIKVTLDRAGTLANSTRNNTSSHSARGSHYWYSRNPGNYVRSYHTTNLGWTTVRQNLLVKR